MIPAAANDAIVRVYPLTKPRNAIDSTAIRRSGVQTGGPAVGHVNAHTHTPTHVARM